MHVLSVVKAGAAFSLLIAVAAAQPAAPQPTAAQAGARPAATSGLPGLQQPPNVTAAAAAAAAAVDVIVIGAGIAGLAAARELSRAGLRVTVLEGRNRTGGRLHSVPTASGHSVDLGAMWIHGAGPNNTLSALAASLGLNVSRPQNYNSGAIFVPGTPNRTSLLGYASVARAWQGLEASITRLRATASAAAAAAAVGGGAVGGGEDFAAGNATGNSTLIVDGPLAERFVAWKEAAGVTGPQQVRQANLMMHTHWQVLLNANATHLSTLRYGDSKRLPAVDVLVAEGMGALTDALADQSRAEGADIRLSTVVTRVIQNGSSVTAVTASGDTFTAPHAIVTLPLGVLKAGTVAFDPPLSQRHTRAVAEMGMGVLDKVVLVWDRPWWPRSSDFISREMADWSGRWSVFLNYAAVFGAPVLVALHAADTALSLEAETDEAIVADALKVLREMGGGATKVPSPRQAIVTRWGADPFSRGSYSYFATDDLAAPFGRLLFAGEATSRAPATAHGAYLSGLREAARLLEMRSAAGGLTPLSAGLPETSSTTAADPGLGLLPGQTAGGVEPAGPPLPAVAVGTEGALGASGQQEGPGDVTAAFLNTVGRQKVPIGG